MYYQEHKCVPHNFSLCVNSLCEARLRWYGDVIRMEEDDPVKVAWRSQVEGRRSRGRQRIRWRNVIERGLKLLGLQEQDAKDRTYWRQHKRWLALSGIGKVKKKKKKKKSLCDKFH